MRFTNISTFRKKIKAMTSAVLGGQTLFVSMPSGQVVVVSKATYDEMKKRT